MSAMEIWPFLLAYTSSGFAGLVYEVSWTRLLTLAMGHGLAASSTVLAAFMGGLALGAGTAGRVASRLTARQALYGYAALELAIAVLGLLLPSELRLLSTVFATAYHDGAGGATFAVVRLAVCLAVLLVPAATLGATFPMAIRGFGRPSIEPGRLAGLLYAANTVGAAAGAVLAGFVLVPRLGVFGTSLVGVAATLVAMGLVLAAARRTLPDAAAAREAPDARSPKAPARPARAERSGSASAAAASQPWLAAAALTVTGVTTFGYEIAWTRVFSLVIGPSTYAFAATVAAFIGGLAGGAVAGTFVVARTRRRALALGVVLGVASLAGAWACGAAGTSLPRRVMLDFAAGPAGGLLLSHALLVAVTIVPVALGIGAAFPLAMALAGGPDAPARRLGALYAVNTLAAVAGSLVTGFVAVPALGLEETLRAVTAILGASAAVAVWRAAGASWPVRLACTIPTAAAFGLLVSGTPWDRALLASGSYKYAASVPRGLDVETALKAGTLVYYRDGATATVSVKRLTGALSLAIDGKVDASTAGDMLTQRLLAHLPLLLHEDPHEVCIIGLGSGVTLASALTHPVRAVDVLEISPEVAEASRLFTQGAQPLDDPRTRLIVADGRTHLALSRRTYDVIVSEPSNPWMAGVAALFTHEFFEAAKARLAEHGIICQWVNTYDISTEDLESVVATFSQTFPHGTMWLVGDGDLLLVGSADPLEARLAAVDAAWQRPGVAADLKTVGAWEPFAVLSMLLGGDDAVARFKGDTAVQTDDRMALEFSGPRALRTAARRDNVERLRQVGASAARPAIVDRAWAAADGGQLARRAAMLRQAGAFEPAYRAGLDAVTKAPDHADALAGFVESAVASGRQTEAIGVLQSLAAEHRGLVPPLVALSRLQAATGAFEPAVRTALGATALAPNDAAALEQLASVFADAGDADRLGPIVDRLVQTHPDRAATAYYAAALAFLRGQLDASRAGAERALSLDARHGRAKNLLGAIHATRGDVASARRAFGEALAIDPRDPVTYQNLGLLELNGGNSTLAAGIFAEALSLDPTSDAARDGLARARAATGAR